MNAIRTQARRQRDTVGVIAIAALAVLAYSLWGSYMLHNAGSGLGRAAGAAVADNR